MLTNRILLATDLTDASRSAEAAALALAKRLDARLIVLHVLPERASLGMSTIPPELSDPTSVEDKLQALGIREAPDADRLLLRGDPAETIVATADKEDVDLLVLGTSGRRGLSRAVLGSVAEAVVRRVNCPVVLVKSSVEVPST